MDTAECSMYAAICLPPEESVKGGQIKATVTTMGFTLLTEMVDICTVLSEAQMKCPVQAGVCVRAHVLWHVNVNVNVLC